MKSFGSLVGAHDDFTEIITVTYDPGMITPEEMVSSLKQAGTYRGNSLLDIVE